MSKCRSCGAEIVWAKHEGTGKIAPLDEPPNPAGNVILFRDYRSRDPVYRIDTLPGGESGRTTNHFATCPDAEAHR